MSKSNNRNIIQRLLGNSYSKKKLIEKQQYERYKLEEEKKLKYNCTNFLNNNNISEIQLNKDLPISSKKENYFKKIFNNIKKLFFK